MMWQAWPAIVMGWPAVALSLILSAVGIAWQRPIWVVAGALAAAPFAVYLGLSPRFQGAALLLPVLHLAAAWAVAKHRPWLACFLLLPFVGLVAWLALMVLGQPA